MVEHYLIQLLEKTKCVKRNLIWPVKILPSLGHIL